jgi:glycosyltransferase involved in cell wall biosynthesis
MAQHGHIQLLSLTDNWVLDNAQKDDGDFSQFLQKLRVPLVWEVGTMGFFDRLAQEGLLGQVSGRVDRFVAVSARIAEEAQNHSIPGDKIEIIRPPVNTALFSPRTPEQKQNVRAALGISDDTPVGIYVGRFNSHKGIDFLLEHWHILSGKAGKLLLLGSAEGVEQDAYLNLIRANPDVIYPGFVTEDLAKATYFNAADYLIFPSKSEGLSLTMLEAMSSGLPSVVFKEAAVNSGLGEIFSEGLTGFSFSEFTPEAVLAAIRQTLIYQDFLGAEARKFVLANIKGYAETAAIFDTLYRSLILSRHS